MYNNIINMLPIYYYNITTVLILAKYEVNIFIQQRYINTQFANIFDTFDTPYIVTHLHMCDRTSILLFVFDFQYIRVLST